MGLNRPNIAELAQKFMNFRAAGGTVTTTAAPAAQPQETTMAKATKKTAAKPAVKKTKNAGVKAGVAKKPDTAKAAGKVSRKDEVISMMKRPGGATTEQIQAQTKMLPHSARALISGIGLSNTVTKTKDGANATVYSIKAKG